MESAKNWVQGWGQGQNSNQGYRLGLGLELGSGEILVQINTRY